MLEMMIAMSGRGVNWDRIEIGAFIEDEGGYFAYRMFDTSGNPYALIVSPKAEGGRDERITHAAARYFVSGLSIGGHTDWALPDRNEFVGLYRAFKPGTGTNSTYSGNSSYTNPPSERYTTTDPTQTTVEAFKMYQSEAFAAGNSNYWGSVTYSGNYADYASFEDGYSRQYNLDSNITNSFYVRAIRRVYY